MEGDSQETTAAPPLSADQINQLLNNVARDVGARADALALLVDELDGEFKSRAAAGDASAHDLRARLAELSRMKDDLSAEFDAKLRDLDAMVKSRLAALAADEDDDAAATAAGGVEEEGSSAAAAEMFEDRSG